MSRLPVAAFVALVVATIAAFFVIQHLKVTTPLLTGFPAPLPAEINPVNGQVCRTRTPAGLKPLSHRTMHVSFYLQNRSDDVNVYIVDRNGAVVDQIGYGVHMVGGTYPVRRQFSWDGRTRSGSVAPDGVYYIRVSLIHLRRSVLISDDAGPEPVTVETVAPRPRITSVAPDLVGRGRATLVTIRYTGTRGLAGRILIYRAAAQGPPHLVKSFASRRGTSSVWDATIGGQPAPPGTYLIRIEITDQACNTGFFPARLAPGLRAAPVPEVTVR